MQKLDWREAFLAFDLILERPFIEKGYKDLSKFYLNNKMKDNADAIDFLIKEKFNANSSNTDEG
jgi:hypothetical protein